MRKFMALTTLLLLTTLMVVTSNAQDDPGYTYEEYSYYQAAVKETNLDKKEAALFEFFDKYPEQKNLRPYVLAEFGQLFQARMGAKQYDAIISCATKVFKYEANAPIAQNFLAQAYYAKGDWANYLKYAEPIYQRDANVTMAYYMADTAIKISDWARAEKYTSAVNQGGTFLMKADLLTKLFRAYASKKMNSDAADKAVRMVVLFERNPNKPDNFKGGDWNKYKNDIMISGYEFLANHYIGAKDYASVIPVLQKLLMMDPKSASNHFRLGMAFWYNGKATMAAPELAAAVALGDSGVSNQARVQLRQLLEKGGSVGTALDEQYERLVNEAKTRLNIT